MGNIGEGTAVDNSRHILQSLYQIGLNSILQESRHSAVSLDLAGGNRVTAVIIGYDNLAQTLLQIVQAISQAQNSHNLGGYRNIKAILTGHAMSLAA